jgi:hypothetical protein
METRDQSLMELRQRGIKALTQALGPVGMVRFLQQFDIGQGDYTRDRESLLAEVSLEDVIAQIKAQRHSNASNRTSGDGSDV